MSGLLESISPVLDCIPPGGLHCQSPGKSRIFKAQEISARDCESAWSAHEYLGGSTQGSGLVYLASGREHHKGQVVKSISDNQQTFNLHHDQFGMRRDECIHKAKLGGLLSFNGPLSASPPYVLQKQSVRKGIEVAKLMLGRM